MKRSEIPTSQYQAFCDTFNTKLEVKLHEVNGVTKLLISIGDEFDDNKESLSLYKEEVNLLSNFLQTIEEYVEER